MADIVYGLDLEQSCVAPGHWRIEGWTVRRTQTGWTVAQFDNEPSPAAKRFRTLRDAREWIADYEHHHR